METINDVVYFLNQSDFITDSESGEDEKIKCFKKSNKR